MLKMSIKRFESLALEICNKKNNCTSMTSIKLNKKLFFKAAKTILCGHKEQ